MKQFLIFSLLAISGISCTMFSGKQNENSSKYEITQDKNPNATGMNEGGKVRIKYDDYEDVLAKEKEEIQNEIIPEAEAKKMIASIPKGGMITSYIFRATVEMGNLKCFTYILQKNGKEIYRRQGGEGMSGPNTVPSVPGRNGPDGFFWQNYDAVIVPESFTSKDTLKLIVADKCLGGRDEFTIKHSK